MGSPLVTSLSLTFTASTRDEEGVSEGVEESSLGVLPPLRRNTDGINLTGATWDCLRKQKHDDELMILFQNEEYGINTTKIIKLSYK